MSNGTNSDETKKLREEKQKSAILTAVEKFLTKKIQILEREKSQIDLTNSNNSITNKELEQQKQILSGLVEAESRKVTKLSKRYYLTIAISAVIITAIIVPYSLYTTTLIGQNYQIKDLGTIKSSYIIQNLQGDTIDTWLSWRLLEGKSIYVNIINADKYPEKAELVKEAILSTETIDVDNKLVHKSTKGITTYYLGWAGALEKASEKPTENYIPKNIEIITSSNGAGEIIIKLDDKTHGDGISGLTKNTSDPYQHQILKSEITIFDVENLSDNQLKTITRHELAHAFGLGHSTDPNDLLYPTVKTGFPYISECVIDAITELYDGSKQSEVICES